MSIFAAPPTSTTRTSPVMPDLLPVALSTSVAVAAAAWWLRSGMFAVSRLIALGLVSWLAQTLLDAGAIPQALLPAYLYLWGTTFVHSVARFRPAMRPLWYRALVSVPSAYFTSATLFGLPWAVAIASGVELRGAFLPYVLAAVGVYQSLSARRADVTVYLGDGSIQGVRRHTSRGRNSPRPLRVVQITDPHLGPFMSAERLARICQRAVDREPDLIVLTGDFLTMESQSDPEVLTRALAPLGAYSGKVFSCLGNHDYEALETVKGALAANGVQLLVDDAAELKTEAGSVQILGSAFHFRDRASHLQKLVARFPRRPGALRLLLLHDPGAFKHIPEGEADLVLSGHTHGGQVGLLSLGMRWTFLRLFGNLPDHGMWARGTNRMYVHRGTGHYGFPLRLGVSAEESLLHIHPVSPSLAPAE
jgi:uncharacterized protein